MKKNILLKLVNYLAFYGLWFLILYSERIRRPILSLPIVFLFLVTHLAYWSKAPLKEAFFIGCMTALGAVNESILSFLGVVFYRDFYFYGVSWWTLSLWAVFASTYWHAFSWLHQRPFLSCFFGATVAPLCYLGIERSGIIAFPEGTLAAVTGVSLLWACVLPVTFAFSSWIHGEGQ